MRDRTFDVIVLGVGAMGSATCLHLARRGARVLGLDRHAIPNDEGSSHGRTRVFRLAYYEHHDYVPLLLRAQEQWRGLERESGAALLTTTGGVWMGPRDSELVHGTAAAARAHGLAHTLYDAGALRARMPEFRLPEGFVGVEEPDAGVLYPERAVATMADLALRHGAELHGHEPARSWTATSAGVSVRTDAGAYHAERLVLSAGAWTGGLLADLGAPLRVSRQMQVWVAPRNPAPFALGRMPLWAVQHPEAGLQYGFPVMPEAPGMKMALHHPGETTDPDAQDRALRESDCEGMRTLLRTTLPSADGPVLAGEACMYTNSPDHHFILDTHPAHANVALGCGFSGHGFKFAPVIGEILADLAQRGATPLPAQFLSLARFGAVASR